MRTDWKVILNKLKFYFLNLTEKQAYSRAWFAGQL